MFYITSLKINIGTLKNSKFSKNRYNILTFKLDILKIRHFILIFKLNTQN